MISPDTWRTAVGVVGNITAAVLFLSTVPTFIGIWKRKSVEQFSVVPYLATLVNCGLWVLYGMPFVHPHSILVITINGAGFVIELCYLAIFLTYCNRKKRIQVLLVIAAELVFLATLTALVLTLAHTTGLRSTIVGSICIAGNIMMYASPLSVMKMVIQTKSIEFMPFFLSLFCFLNGLAWTAYALIRLDYFIVIPNSIGAFSGMVQLVLYAAFYKNTQRMLAERKAKAELGLAEPVSPADLQKKPIGLDQV